MLRDAGIEAVNLDLMYGLPEQTVADVRAHRRRSPPACRRRGSRIFGYAHVPWFKTHQRLIDAATLPGAGRAHAHRPTPRAQRSWRDGYEAIGLDHFARPDDPMAVAARDGTLRRNFQGYTTDEADALLGLGAVLDRPPAAAATCRTRRTSAAGAARSRRAARRSSRGVAVLGRRPRPRRP